MSSLFLDGNTDTLDGTVISGDYDTVCIANVGEDDKITIENSNIDRLIISNADGNNIEVVNCEIGEMSVKEMENFCDFEFTSSEIQDMNIEKTDVSKSDFGDCVKESIGLYEVKGAGDADFSCVREISAYGTDVDGLHVSVDFDGEIHLDDECVGNIDESAIDYVEANPNDAYEYNDLDRVTISYELIDKGSEYLKEVEQIDDKLEAAMSELTAIRDDIEKGNEDIENNTDSGIETNNDNEIDVNDYDGEIAELDNAYS